MRLKYAIRIPMWVSRVVVLFLLLEKGVGFEQ